MRKSLFLTSFNFKYFILIWKINTGNFSFQPTFHVDEVGHSLRSCWSDSEKVEAEDRRRVIHGEEDRKAAASEVEEEEQLVEGKVFVDLTFAGGGVNGGGRGASSTGSTSSTQQQGSRGRGHWDNQVQEVIKSTRFLVNQVAAKVDKKEGDKLRIYSSKGRPGGR